MWKLTIVLLLCASAGFCLAQSSTLSRTDKRGNRAVVIQSNPGNGAAVTVVRKGPGFVILDQRDGQNRAIIIQGE